jgi:hypothetical protein
MFALLILLLSGMREGRLGRVGGRVEENVYWEVVGGEGLEVRRLRVGVVEQVVECEVGEEKCNVISHYSHYWEIDVKFEYLYSLVM